MIDAHWTLLPDLTANYKSEKVIKLTDPDNENISFSNNNNGVVILI